MASSSGAEQGGSESEAHPTTVLSGHGSVASYIRDRNCGQSQHRTSATDRSSTESKFPDAVTEKISELEAAKAVAVDTEDFEAAGRMKKALETAKALGEELCRLEVRKKVAVKKEDYEDAASAKRALAIITKRLAKLGLEHDSSDDAPSGTNAIASPATRLEQHRSTEATGSSTAASMVPAAYAIRLARKSSDGCPVGRPGWTQYAATDVDIGEDVHQMLADDLQECMLVAEECAFGAFVVFQGVAYFREPPGTELKARLLQSDPSVACFVYERTYLAAQVSSYASVSAVAAFEELGNTSETMGELSAAAVQPEAVAAANAGSLAGSNSTKMEAAEAPETSFAAAPVAAAAAAASHATPQALLETARAKVAQALQEAAQKKAAKVDGDRAPMRTGYMDQLIGGPQEQELAAPLATIAAAGSSSLLESAREEAAKALEDAAQKRLAQAAPPAASSTAPAATCAASSKSAFPPAATAASSSAVLVSAASTEPRAATEAALQTLEYDIRLARKSSDGSNIGRPGWTRYPSTDVDAGDDAFQMPADDLEACMLVAEECAFGGFSIYGGTAYFREPPGFDLRERLLQGDACVTFFLYDPYSVSKSSHDFASCVPAGLERKQTAEPTHHNEEDEDLAAALALSLKPKTLLGTPKGGGGSDQRTSISQPADENQRVVSGPREAYFCETETSTSSSAFDQAQPKPLLTPREAAAAARKLFACVRDRDTPLIAELLSTGAPVDARDDDGNTALSILASTAAMTNCMKRLSVLLRAEPALDVKNMLGETALQLAVRNSNAVVALRLLQLRADPNLQDQFGEGALAEAVMKEDLGLTKLLLRFRANVGADFGASHDEKNGEAAIFTLTDNSDILSLLRKEANAQSLEATSKQKEPPPPEVVKGFAPPDRAESDHEAAQRERAYQMHQFQVDRENYNIRNPEGSHSRRAQREAEVRNLEKQHQDRTQTNFQQRHQQQQEYQHQHQPQPKSQKQPPQQQQCQRESNSAPSDAAARSHDERRRLAEQRAAALEARAQREEDELIAMAVAAEQRHIAEEAERKKRDKGVYEYK